MTVSPTERLPVHPQSGPARVAGLRSEEATRRLVAHGPNLVRASGRRSLLVRAGIALREPLVLVLMAAAVLTAATGDVADTVVIAVVVVVNTSVSLWQEGRAERAVAALAAMTSPECRVVRDGAEVSIQVADLVPGDIVLLGEGDVVPADAVVVDGAALGIDEAALTGESVPVDKGPAQSMWAGTTVVHGRATAQVVGTGADSAIGRIAAMLDVAAVRTPLQRRMGELSRLLALVAVAVSGVVLVVGLARGEPLELMTLTAVSLVVAAVPESLPVVVTLSLALAARRMARHRAVVRSLAAVETLGSVTLLATDKTGTLTEGRMTVDTLWWPTSSSREALMRAVVLCNDARVVGSSSLGDPTEVALLQKAQAHGIHRHDLERALPRLDERPFDSDRKRMSTAHAAPGGILVVCKGAPEAILDRAVVVDDEGTIAAARSRADAFAANGARVLAVAERLDAGGAGGGLGAERPAEKGLRLLGLVALNDPARPAASTTVAALRDAGIRTVLVTGDNSLTARDLARRVGITTSGGVLDLSQSRWGDDDLTGASVLARATPAQKLTAIQAWQAGGDVVAMTGDGVNDAPALHRADIGVAMGVRGTDVARQAADLVLADDELSTVVTAVREGRRVYANIRRFLLYGLSGGAAELLVMLAGPFAGIALPLLPAQILWVNLLTHSLAGTALGAEPADADVLARPPRDPREGVLGGGLWWRVLALAAVIAAASLLAGWLLADDGLPEARSGVLLALGAGQLGVALGVRTRRRGTAERNPLLPVSVVAAAALLVAAVQVPPLQLLLSTAIVPVTGWWVAVGSGVASLLAARWWTTPPAGGATTRS